MRIFLTIEAMSEVMRSIHMASDYRARLRHALADADYGAQLDAMLIGLICMPAPLRAVQFKRRPTRIRSNYEFQPKGMAPFRFRRCLVGDSVLSYTGMVACSTITEAAALMREAIMQFCADEVGRLAGFDRQRFSRDLMTVPLDEQPDVHVGSAP